MDKVSDVHQAAAACYDTMARKHATDMSSNETPFRHFNNFVKKSLIQTALDTAHAKGVRNAAVLDLASGRGGDLMKWTYLQSPKLSKATLKLSRSELTKATEYHCYDISPESIASAQHRADGRTPQQIQELTCTFDVANCFDESFLDGELIHHPLFGKFDAITIQFAFHYACSSRERVRRVLERCHQALSEAGVFIATLVDSEQVVARLDTTTKTIDGAAFHIAFRGDNGAAPTDGAAPPQQPDNAAAGTEDYQGDATTSLTTTTPDGNATRGLHLGARYHFLLQDFVDCDEYFVPIADLRSIAMDVGFVVDEGKPFESSIGQYRLDPKSLPLSAADKELISMYRTVVLMKQKPERDASASRSGLWRR